MTTPEQIPGSTLERAQMLQAVLISRATGGSADDAGYEVLRKFFFANTTYRPLLPDFVRSSRDLSQFWGHIKMTAASYQERRQIIWSAFEPLLDHLEEADRSPADQVIAEGLVRLEADAVLEIWTKALSRRTTDPEGAITSARQLLESVCKHILDDEQIEYSKDADLQKLWRQCAEQLNLAPDQHNEVAFKSVLGGCQTIVHYLGTIRNRLGDAHGSGRVPAKPASRHAALVVNPSGTMATFLVETYAERKAKRGQPS
jgi:Abortive infection C-terminus